MLQLPQMPQRFVRSMWARIHLDQHPFQGDGAAEDDGFGG
jgi:hypothetical protein